MGKKIFKGRFRDFVQFKIKFAMIFLQIERFKKFMELYQGRPSFFLF